MSGSVPAWIEKLLGLPSQAGEGTAWSVSGGWPWPVSVSVLGGLVAAYLIAAAYRREQASRSLRTRLAAIRLALLLVVLAMTAQLTLSIRRTGLPSLAVVLDDSQSMGIVDAYEQPVAREMTRRIGGSAAGSPRRWDLATWLATAGRRPLVQAVGGRYRLRFYLVSAASTGLGAAGGLAAADVGRAEPAAATSRLGLAIRGVLDDLRGTAPAAIVVLSDGVNTAGPSLAEAASEARRQGVPLYTVGLGQEKPVSDIKLYDLIAEDVVFVDDLVYFEAKLSGKGFAGKAVRVLLRESGGSQIVAETTAVIPADGQPLAVRLPVRPRREGDFRYSLEVDPQQGELDEANNRQERLLRVRKEKIRVLLVQGYPSFEYRYLRNMLRRDETIALSTVLQEADPEHADQGEGMLSGFPVRREDLNAYDVLILGDADPALLDAAMLENIARFATDSDTGGSLIAIAGPRFMPLAYRSTALAALLPIELSTAVVAPPIDQGFALAPTEYGLASPMLELGESAADTRAVWDNLPPLYWRLEAQPKGTARVLAESSAASDAEGRSWPIIAMQYVGAGRVLFHATDETWRWRYRTGDLYFSRYWIQTIRYLARSKLFQGNGTATLTTDRREYRPGEQVTLRLRFGDERAAPSGETGAAVVVERTGGADQKVSLGRTPNGRGVFEGVLAASAPGSYHARLEQPVLAGSVPTADFSIVVPPGEFERTEMDAGELRRAAERTGGRYYTFLSADRLADQLPDGRQVPIETLPAIRLWNRWPLIALVLAMLIVEWVLRKRAGLS